MLTLARAEFLLVLSGLMCSRVLTLASSCLFVCCFVSFLAFQHTYFLVARYFYVAYLSYLSGTILDVLLLFERSSLRLTLAFLFVFLLCYLVLCLLMCFSVCAGCLPPLLFCLTFSLFRPFSFLLSLSLPLFFSLVASELTQSDRRIDDGDRTQNLCELFRARFLFWISQRKPGCTSGMFGLC